MKTQADHIECAQCRQKVKAQTARKSAPILLTDTPIYAAMVRLVTAADRLAKEHPELPPLPASKPLLKNRKTRR